MRYVCAGRQLPERGGSEVGAAHEPVLGKIELIEGLGIEIGGFQRDSRPPRAPSYGSLKEEDMRNRTRVRALAVKVILAASAVLAVTLFSPAAAEEALMVRGVRIDCGQIEPRIVGVVGQLTLNGEPVPGTMFALQCDEEEVLDIRYFLSSELRERLLAERAVKIRRAIREDMLERLVLVRENVGVRANGVEMAFIRGARGIVVVHLGPEDFRLEKPYLLLERGVKDPPGEAAVAFF